MACRTDRKLTRSHLTQTLAATDEYFENHISKHRKRDSYVGNGSGINHWSCVRQVVGCVFRRHS